MEWTIVSCDENRDPATVALIGPYGANIELPKPFYDYFRDLLGLPELICPTLDI